MHEQATTFDLVINVKMSKTIALPIFSTLLIAAGEVIE